LKIKGIQDEDFINYKKPSMFIGFPYCSWKCDRECGMQVCQNSALAAAPSIEISCRAIVKRYEQNDITKAIVLGGLEPFDSWTDLFELIMMFQIYSNQPDIVIYTGYKKEEISNYVSRLITAYKGPLIIKYGRFIPNQKKHYDEVLGVWLASDNQYAERIE